MSAAKYDGRRMSAVRLIRILQVAGVTECLAIFQRAVLHVSPSEPSRASCPVRHCISSGLFQVFKRPCRPSYSPAKNGYTALTETDEDRKRRRSDAAVSGGRKSAWHDESDYLVVILMLLDAVTTLYDASSRRVAGVTGLAPVGTLS
jgi:hypothetical protein